MTLLAVLTTITMPTHGNGTQICPRWRRRGQISLLEQLDENLLSRGNDVRDPIPVCYQRLTLLHFVLSCHSVLLASLVVYLAS
jgi:hypothetical protein